MRAKRLAPYLFVLPSLLGLLAFFYVPFLWSARFLFLGQDGGALASFQRTLKNEMFLSGSGNTMLFCLCCVPPLLLLSTGLATGLRYAQRSAGAFWACCFCPMCCRSRRWWRFLAICSTIAAPSTACWRRWGREGAVAGQRRHRAGGGAAVSLAEHGLCAGVPFGQALRAAQGAAGGRQLDGAGYWRCCRHLLLPYLLPALTFVGVRPSCRPRTCSGRYTCSPAPTRRRRPIRCNTFCSTASTRGISPP